MTLPVQVDPPIETAWIEATLEAGTQPNGEPGSIFVRPTPGANEWVALVKDGAPIWYKTEPVKEVSSKGVVYKWLYVKTEHGVEGWMALVQPGATPQKPDAQFVPKVVTPPVEEPETPTETDPDDTQENPSIQFVTKDELLNANEAQDEKWARYFADQMAVRDERVKHLQDRVDALERVLRGFGVQIDNELPLAG